MNSEQVDYEKEKKAIVLSISTLVAFCIPTFLKEGQFVFPTPFNDALLAILVVYFAYLHIRIEKWIYLSLLGFSLARIVANPYYLNFIFTSEELERIQLSSFQLIMQGVSFCFLLAYFVFFAVKNKKKNMAILFSPIFLLINLLFPSPYLTILGISLFLLFFGLGSLFLGEKQYTPYKSSLYILLLLLVFAFTEFSNSHFLGN